MMNTIEDLLRLAWLANSDEKPGLRDALLTLAAVDSGRDDAVLAERCRRLLVARRPDHWFATTPTVGSAMSHPQVAAALARLRTTFPPVRVQRHLLRYEVQSGPFTGRSTSLNRVLEDLSLVPDEAKTKPRSRPVPINQDRAQALPFPGTSTQIDADGSLSNFYLTILLAMAVLLKTVTEPSSLDNSQAA